MIHNISIILEGLNISLCRLLLNLPQPTNGTPHSDGTGRAQTVCATGDDLPTTLAAPNSDDGPLD